MSAIKRVEEEYKKIIKASNLRVGFFVTVSRKLTDKEIKTWPWGYQPCEKYIGCSRHILMDNGIGYTLNGIDITFPIEMLTPTAVSTVPAPYLPPTKGVETFTGYQIITENDVHMCLSTGRVYQLYFNDKCQASEFLKDKKVEFELYSICLELVNNIIKHSKATEAKIEISKTENQLKLTVEDNGIGIFENNSDGKGMKNVRARVESLNGTWNIASKESKGTNSQIIIPI